MPGATVVGSGPNGLSAAIALARAGHPVRVLEAAATVGGGARTTELTLPGFRHDVCSAIHPLAVCSPFLRDVPLALHGVEWIQPDVPVAHPLDGGRAVLLERDVNETAVRLGADARPYRRLLGPLVADWERLAPQLLGPLRVPSHPVALARFGRVGLRSAAALARARFTGDAAQALFAGLAAHSVLALERRGSASFGLVLGALGHVVGWPFPRGGAQTLADGLAGYLRSLGGDVETGRTVESIDELAGGGLALLDVTPSQFLRLAEGRLQGSYRRRLTGYRYGPGVFKLDLALDGPVPWAAPECARAATVHVGGTLREIAAAEAVVAAGRHPERPFVLVAQPSLFDPSRAPAGKHTLWAYCHVPNGSREDMTAAIEAQIERFAPGFRDLVLARHTMTTADLERYNANYVGGDINGGLQDLRQLFARPVARLDPYATPLRGVFLCSSATPPGGGVHGMCGYHAARSALRARAGRAPHERRG